jgi:hypothetical protein
MSELNNKYRFSNEKFRDTFFMLFWFLFCVFWMGLACASNEAGEQVKPSRCLTFSKSKFVNKVSQFRKKQHIDAGSTVYSASFDLDDDGAPEYFYFLDEPGAPSCGTISLQIGCPVEIYRYSNKRKFINISGDPIYPSLDFNPVKQRDYLCVSSYKLNGWYSLIKNNELVHKGSGVGVFKYDGTVYKLIQKEN